MKSYVIKELVLGALFPSTDLSIGQFRTIPRNRLFSQSPEDTRAKQEAHSAKISQDWENNKEITVTIYYVSSKAVLLKNQWNQRF